MKRLPVELLLIVLGMAAPAHTQNLLVNPGFAGNLNGWLLQSGPHFASFDPTRNASGALSGSAKSVNDADQSSNPYCNGSSICVTVFPVAQCVPVTAGKTYAFGAKILIPDGQATTGEGGVGVNFWTNSTCSAGFAGFVAAPAVTETGRWTRVSAATQIPSGALSARIVASNGRHQKTGDHQVNYDDFFFQETTADPCATGSIGEQVPVGATGFRRDYGGRGVQFGFVATNVGVIPVFNPFVLILAVRAMNNTDIEVRGAPTTECFPPGTKRYAHFTDRLDPGQSAQANIQIIPYASFTAGFSVSWRIHALSGLIH